jgi:hypothetical protein
MSQPQEKAVGTAYVVADGVGDVPLGSKSPYQASEDSVYIESKRTWRSALWSSMFPLVMAHGRRVPLADPL